MKLVRKLRATAGRRPLLVGGAGLLLLGLIWKLRNGGGSGGRRPSSPPRRAALPAARRGLAERRAPDVEESMEAEDEQQTAAAPTSPAKSASVLTLPSQPLPRSKLPAGDADEEGEEEEASTPALALSSPHSDSSGSSSEGDSTALGISPRVMFTEDDDPLELLLASVLAGVDSGSLLTPSTEWNDVISAVRHGDWMRARSAMPALLSALAAKGDGGSGSIIAARQLLLLLHCGAHCGAWSCVHSLAWEAEDLPLFDRLHRASLRDYRRPDYAVLDAMALDGQADLPLSSALPGAKGGERVLAVRSIRIRFRCAASPDADYAASLNATSSKDWHEVGTHYPALIVRGMLATWKNPEERSEVPLVGPMTATSLVLAGYTVMSGGDSAVSSAASGGGGSGGAAEGGSEAVMATATPTGETLLLQELWKLSAVEGRAGLWTGSYQIMSETGEEEPVSVLAPSEELNSFTYDVEMQLDV